MDLREQFLCNALDRFKEMITNGDCSKADITYFCNLSKYELDRRGAAIDKKRWLTKIEASQMLEVSTSTFDRMILKGVLPRGKKVVHQKCLMWKCDDIEQLKHIMLLNANS
jgi:hypothetical protein